jgi:hypothetical protein
MTPSKPPGPRCSTLVRPASRPATSSPPRRKVSGRPTRRILVRHGFPHHAVTAATLRAGEECLADAAFPASLHRLLADQLDDLRRALQIRASAS